MSSTASGETLESMSQAVWYNKWTMRKFASFLNGEILEVGCGIGNFTNSLSQYGKVWAIDINRDYLSKTKELVGDGIKVGFGDIENGDYFFGEKKFNCVVCLNVLEHIRNDEKALRNLNKLLKENGYLILLVPAHNFLFSKIDESIGHYRRYNKKSLIKMIGENNFTVIKSWKLNFLGAIGWYFAGKILNEKTIGDEKIKFFNVLAPVFLKIENLIKPPLGTSILIVAKKKI